MTVCLIYLSRLLKHVLGVCSFIVARINITIMTRIATIQQRYLMIAIVAISMVTTRMTMATAIRMIILI